MLHPDVRTFTIPASGTVLLVRFYFTLNTLNITTTGIAINSPTAVATSASAMPGPTTLARWIAPKPEGNDDTNDCAEQPDEGRVVSVFRNTLETGRIAVSARSTHSRSFVPQQQGKRPRGHRR